MIFLLRHADAGEKKTWTGPDDQRPLSEAGWRQARGLVAQLQGWPVEAIVSSPALRCRQSVEPLAAQRRLAVQPDGRLAVEADAEAAVALVLAAASGTVLCTHGELLGQVITWLREQGAPIGPHARWPKGSTWALRRSGRNVTYATYLPPPRADPAPGKPT